MCVRVLGSLSPVAFYLSISVSSGSCDVSCDVSCEMLKCMSTAQGLTKYVSAFWAQSGPRHFFFKFPYKVAVTTSCLQMSAVVAGYGDVSVCEMFSSV